MSVLLWSKCTVGQGDCTLPLGLVSSVDTLHREEHTCQVSTCSPVHNQRLAYRQACAHAQTKTSHICPQKTLRHVQLRIHRCVWRILWSLLWMKYVLVSWKWERITVHKLVPQGENSYLCFQHPSQAKHFLCYIAPCVQSNTFVWIKSQHHKWHTRTP